MTYKDYQQVILFAAKKTHSPTAEKAPKKRTKTGCLTCRRRKKKCDESIEGGKCQGCTRNFLDCCWPTLAPETQPKTPEQVAKPQPAVGANAYPSPDMSPKAEYAADLDVKPFLLLGLRYKVMKPKAKKPTPKQTQGVRFVNSSFDLQNALCLVN